jgi:hypothetical protein
VVRLLYSFAVPVIAGIAVFTGGGVGLVVVLVVGVVGTAGVTGGCDVVGVVGVPAGGGTGDDGFGVGVLTQRRTLTRTIRPCRRTMRP